MQASSSSSGSSGVFASLGNARFRLLWLGSLTALVGFFMSNVVQNVVAFELTGANTSVGLVAFGRGLAMAALSPIGGAVADRMSKKVILLSCQTITAVVFFVLAALHWSGRLVVPHLVMGGFAVGLTFAFLGPTRQAYVVELVDEQRLGNAVALNQVALNASRVAGPALGGVLLAWQGFGATGCFVLMGALYMLAVLTQGQLPPSVPSDAGGAGVLSDVVEGVRYLRGQPLLRALLLFYVLLVMLGFPYVTLVPGLVSNVLGGNADDVGLLYGVAAAGGLVSSLWLAPRADSSVALLIHVGMGLAFALSLALLGQVHVPWLGVVGILAVGMTSGAVTTLNGALLVRNTESRYVGRIMSLSMLAFAGFGLMGLPIGMLADAIGEGSALGVMGGAVGLCVLVLGGAILRHRDHDRAAGVSRG